MASSGIYEEDYDDDGDSVLAVESDVDSNFEDSPVDGYFSERPHPQETFVQNSSILAEADSKANEAAQERASSSRAVPPSHSNSATTPSRPVSWPEVETPVAHHEAPPPDYEAATASRSVTDGSSNSPNVHSPTQTSYGSVQNSNMSREIPSSQTDNPWPFGSRGNPFGPNQPWPLGNVGNPFTQGFPFGQSGGVFGQSTVTPPSEHQQATQHEQHAHFQSMSDTAQPMNADEETGLLNARRKWRKRRRWCNGCKPMSCFNTILIVAIIILIIVLSSGSDDADNNVTDPKEPDKSTPDDGHGTPTIPPTIPSTIPSTPPIPSIPASAHCPYEYYSETVMADFDRPRNFSFTEFVESDHFSGGVFGLLRVRAGPEDQTPDIRAYLTVATTRPWKMKQIGFNQDGDSLSIGELTMEKTKSGYSGRPCIWFFVRLEIRPGVKLDAFEIATGSLDVVIEDGLFNATQGSQKQPAFEVMQSSHLYAVRGSLDIAYWSSRETVVEVIAGSIKGKFALRDLLSLQTRAGSIHVDVDPKKADPDRPRSAEFIATSNAGSIDVRYPTAGYIPERVYRSRVETVSSSVSGNYILGSVTSIKTESGQINAVMLPYFDRKLSSTFITETRAGSTNLDILTPYDYPGEPWSDADSTHKTSSVSGSIDITYPQVWEGGINCESVSGSIRVSGKDIKITKDERFGPMRSVKAIKGDGDGKIKLESVAGSIRLNVGDES